MEKYIYDAINKYFKTLSVIGTIDSTEKYKLYIIGALYSVTKTFAALVTKEDVEKFNTYIECLVNSSCLFDKNVPSLNYEDSLITIIDNDIITDHGGTTLVSNQRKTRTFNDFVVRTDVEADQYVVGYDQSENDEVAINVTDLGVFWDIDI